MLRPFAALTTLFLSVALCAAQPAAPPPKGQGVFSAGHSFHMFVPPILRELAASAGIRDHVQVGAQSIGGSRTIQHWERPDETNEAKKALRTGKVDVLTLSPIYHPDPGVDHFVKLAVEHNPDVRVLVQASWLPYDVFDPDYQKKPKPAKVEWNARTGGELRAMHAKYAKTQETQVTELNKQFGKPVVSVVPVGQAVILLREKIAAGKAPGLKTQDELFTDAIGHGQPPLKALAAYCYFAAIYRQSPVGLPAPSVLKSAQKPEWDDKLNRLLQELAWEAVTSHPLSGVKVSK